MENKSYPKSFQLQVTHEQHRKLRDHSLATGINMADLLRNYIDGLPEYKTRRVVVRRAK